MIEAKGEPLVNFAKLHTLPRDLVKILGYTNDVVGRTIDLRAMRAHGVPTPFDSHQVEQMDTTLGIRRQSFDHPIVFAIHELTYPMFYGGKMIYFLARAVVGVFSDKDMYDQTTDIHPNGYTPARMVAKSDLDSSEVKSAGIPPQDQ